LATIQSQAQSELDLLLDVLPPRVSEILRGRDDAEDLLEVVLDLGRLPEARFLFGDVPLAEEEVVTREELDQLVERVGDFGGDNRAGIERTLHRISAIRNRKGQVVGITCRVGRAVYGTIKVIEDLTLSGKNILLLGRPGVGKTTMLREVARVLADEAKKRVIIVDTSNEIAGDGDVPHPAIGHSRRMQVATPTEQHGVMIEAVENHMPEVIIIDEMGTEQEAAAARTIAERGVQLVATAHGNTLDNLILNPTLSDLIGGVQSVTLGDQEARYRGTQKTVLERKAPPTFDVVVEIQSWTQVAVNDDVAHVVDQWLRGYPIAREIRYLDEDGEVKQLQDARSQGEGAPAAWEVGYSQQERGQERGFDSGYLPLNGGGPIEASPSSARRIDARVFLFGVSRDKLEVAQTETNLGIDMANELRQATLVLTTKNHYRRGAHLVKVAESSGTPVYVLRKNTMPQVMEFLRTLAKEQGLDVGAGRLSRSDSGEATATMEEAMQEAEEAAQKVLEGEFSIQLTPQRAYVRRLQHILAQRFSLASTSRGREPSRAVLIYRP
jgi:stage III sporulation protein SpoIIIAA